MKNLLKLLILLTAVFSSLVQAKLNVFACEPEWAALAEVIGGDLVKTTSATNALQDPHYIQARPSLIAKIRKADLLVCSGSELEIGWLPLLLRKGNNPKIQTGKPGNLMASQFVRRLDIPTVLDRAQGDMHSQGNPHIQTNPHNIAIVASVVAERLQQIDPGNADSYQQNLAEFLQQWNQAITGWEQRAANLRGQEIVVHHKSWVYLEDWLGLVEVATLESKPGIPPSGAHLSQLLAQMKTKPAKLIIRSPYQDAKASAWLSEKTGIPATLLPFTVGGSDNANDLFKLFDETIHLLVIHLDTAE
ncbi:MAG: zinc ABC transporter substrate-binding protein [Proteobacteria bacterium]|nr:zinc ABC transporter substrate-binding protein [Pseudomonadota bacterium]